MSFWSRLGIAIQDLECFKASCAEHDVSYEENQDANFKMQGMPVHATLKDLKAEGYGSNSAYLVRDGGAYKIVVDNDVNWSTFSRRLGTNGGKVARDYTKGVVMKGVKRNGGMINLVQEQPDGSIIMKVSALG